MSSKASTSVLEKSFTKYSQGLSLFVREFMGSVLKHGLTLKEVAEKVGISDEDFKKKLFLKQRFSVDELKALIDIFGAKEMLNAIWLPTFAEKKKVKKYVLELGEEVVGYSENIFKVENDLCKDIELTDEEKHNFEEFIKGFDKGFYSKLFGKKENE